MGRMEKVYQFLRPLSIIFFVITFVWLSKAITLGVYPDFQTQYFVPQIVFNGGDPYRGASDLYTPQVYPPTEFLFFIPFSILPIEISGIFYISLSIAAFYASFYFLAKTFGVPFFSTTNLFLMGLAASIFPAKFTLGMGQINMFVMVLLSACLYTIKMNKFFTGGIWLGLSLVIKMFPPLLLGYFLIRPNKKLLTGLACAILVSGLFTIIFIPIEVIKSFFEILPSLFNSWKLDYYNQALSGFVGRSFGTGTTGLVIKNLISLVLAGSVLIIILKNKKKDFMTTALIFGSLITLNVIINTFSWQHHFVWLIIPFYIFFMRLKKKKRGMAMFVNLGIAYALVSINLKTPDEVPIIFQSHVFFGAVILLLIQSKLLIDNRS